MNLAGAILWGLMCFPPIDLAAGRVTPLPGRRTVQACCCSGDLGFSWRAAGTIMSSMSSQSMNKVLVVDDDEDQCRLLAVALAGQGYVTRPADDGI